MIHTWQSVSTIDSTLYLHLFYFRFNWILSACQGSTEDDGPGLGCGGYDDTPNTQQYKNIGTQVWHLFKNRNIQLSYLHTSVTDINSFLKTSVREEIYL